MEPTAGPLVKNRPFWVLLGVAFLMHLASYLVIPVLPVYLGTNQGFSLSQVGWILGVGNAAYLVGSMGGGFLADYWGRRALMIAGALLQGGAMLGYFSSGSFSSFAVFSALNGIGTGLLAPALKARIADVVTESQRTRAFSWRGIAANAGIIAAGLATTALALASDRRLFAVAASAQLLLALVTLVGLSRDRCEGADCAPVPFDAYLQILRHRSFMLFSAASLLIWALYAQFAMVVPLRGELVLGGAASIGLIWTINSVAVVLLQGPLSRLVLERFSPYAILVAGTLLLGAGLLSLGWARNFPALSASALTFVLGEMLLLPVIDTLIGHFAREEWMGAYFGISNVVAGIGNALGTSLGGMMVERLGGVGSMSPWIAYGLSALTLAALLGLFAVYATPRHGAGRSAHPIVSRKEKAR